MWVCALCKRANLLVRSSGGLTGSRIALLLARVPIESTLIELSGSLVPLGVEVQHVTLLASTCVDNIYTVGNTPAASTAQQRWN